MEALITGCSNTCSRDGQCLGPASLFFFFWFWKSSFSIPSGKQRAGASVLLPLESCNADYLVCLNKDLAHPHCTIMVAALKHLRNECYVVVVFLLSSDLPHRYREIMLFPLWVNISLRRKKLKTLYGFHHLIEQGVNRNDYFRVLWEIMQPLHERSHTNWLRPACMK